MKIVASIALQILLLCLALVVTILRCWIRLRVERRVLRLPDYLVWGGWTCAMGWVACSIKVLYLEIDHPLAEDLTTDSVEYLKTVFISCYFFDVGLYFPKISLIVFYWWLIPKGFRRLQIALHVATTFLVSAFVATILTDTLIARPISDNWSIENQLHSVWNSFHGLAINWTLNFSTDLLLFSLPFFIINRLKLRPRQKIGLVCVFSLGLITIAISLARFIVYTATNYTVDDASGNAWCTAEMCTAVIVVSLPTLKPLIVRPISMKTSNRSNNVHMQTGSDNPITHGEGTYRSHIQGGKMEDEMELIFLDRRPSPSLTGTTSGTGTQDGKDAVRVTTNVTITRM